MTMATHPQVLRKLRHYCRYLEVSDVGNYISHGQLAILTEESRQRTSPDDPIGFAVTIARRSMMELRRSERADRDRLKVYAESRPTVCLPRHDRIDVRAMLDSLPKWEAMAVDALYGLGFTERQIAASTGRSHQEVHERIRQAVNRLRSRFPSYLPERTAKRYKARPTLGR